MHENFVDLNILRREFYGDFNIWRSIIYFLIRGGNNKCLPSLQINAPESYKRKLEAKECFRKKQTRIFTKI